MLAFVCYFDLIHRVFDSNARPIRGASFMALSRSDILVLVTMEKEAVLAPSFQLSCRIFYDNSIGIEGNIHGG
jgi:hypothetical protein